MIRKGNLGRRQLHFTTSIIWNLDRDEELLNKADEVRKRFGLSMSKLIRKSLRYLLEQYAYEEKKESIGKELVESEE